MNRKQLNGKINIKKVFFSIVFSLLLLAPSSVIGTNIIPPTREPAPTPTAKDMIDDDMTPEVVVKDIIEPPSHAPLGLHDITAQFSTVGIIVNGIRDVDENEPWVEHWESPDDNGTPCVNIYTACDEDYIYIAFENQTGSLPVKAGELFIDTNMNGIWDGPETDMFLTFLYNSTVLKDYDNQPIPDSKVGWGNFVEIQIPKTYWAECNDWAYRVSSQLCGGYYPCIVSLPSSPVTAEIHNGTESYFNTTLSSVPPGYDVEDSAYLGWCIEFGTPANSSPHPTKLFSSYCPPISLQHENWSKVNYILNNKPCGATKMDIQKAIWYFMNFGSMDPPSPDTPVSKDLVNDTIANGDGFIPEPGDVVAVICDPQDQCPVIQHSIIEVLVQEENCSWNPNWGNNSHPSVTPPDDEFLNFTCEYDYNCSCGVAFKALVDIFKIMPGDCHTVYETDFEDLDNISNEWIAKSLDGENDDTWNISTNRSYSSSHSYHCTRFEEYYGNAYDVLEMKNGFDFSDVLNVTFSFWHWCQGDFYDVNGQTQIADYGDVEFYTDIGSGWQWISLTDLCISSIYYDNDWTYTSITIDKSTTYQIDGMNVSGDTLLRDGNKFRFVWRSDPQFQFEGCYIDDIELIVCGDEWVDDQPIWQSQNLPPDYWCAPFNSTIQETFPLQWNATEEGKYLIQVCIQEENPWDGGSCKDKVVIIGDIHDVAVIDLDPAIIIEPGEDLEIEATIKNVGTVDETDVEVQATLKKNGVGSPIWQRSVVLDTLNVSEEKTVNFTWEDATYCDYLLEVQAVLTHHQDKYPANNSKSKWILVATTLFYDHMDDECNWTHKDLTGGDGHWTICSSGYDEYLWCGLPQTTLYGNNWNDVAQINESFMGYEEITISFETYYEINESDFGYLEYSLDGGRHWNILGASFTGFSDWKTVNRSFACDVTDEIMIRFRFYSNATITDRGWILDNVSVESNGTLLFFDDFQSGVEDWVIERLRAGDWWQRRVKPTPESAGNMAWWCGDETIGMYPPNLNDVLTLKGTCAAGIDLSKAFEADVLFSTWYNMSEGDMGYVEISDDDGATWDILGTLNGTSGNDTPTWKTVWYDISGYVGSIVILRFRFTSDNEYESEGWYVDDVRVVAKLDTTPPVTTATLSGTMGNNNWYTSNVQITLSATDDYSGVDAIYYRLDGQSQQTYTAPITVSTDGVHSIEYWAVDNVGNIEAPKEESFRIDKTAPHVLKITKPTGGIYWRDRKLWPLFNLTLFSWSTPIIFGAITIEVTADDATSGVDHVDFYIDADLQYTDEVAPYSWMWDETVFFTHTIKVEAFDEAGNSATLSQDVKIFNINLFG